MDPISNFLMKHVVENAAHLIMPLMVVAFVGGIALRLSIYYLLRAQRRFAVEFERRVRTYHGDPSLPRVNSFSGILRVLLTKTSQELVEQRRKRGRFSRDFVESLIDRLFLIENGARRLAQDILYQARYLRKRPGHDVSDAQMLELVRGAHENNPYYNRLFGFIPTGTLHDLLNALPALFVIGGIFGTFLGIAKALPALGAMDLTNAAETKQVMDGFLVAISLAMVKSIVGIGFSILTTLANTVLNLDGVFIQTIHRFSGATSQLWAESDNNDVEADPTRRAG
jgi:hypothetical protein